jgi:hypothetical protein
VAPQNPSARAPIRPCVHRSSLFSLPPPPCLLQRSPRLPTPLGALRQPYAIRVIAPTSPRRLRPPPSPRHGERLLRLRPPLPLLHQRSRWPSTTSPLRPPTTARPPRQAATAAPRRAPCLDVPLPCSTAWAHPTSRSRVTMTPWPRHREAPSCRAPLLHPR